MAFPASSVTPVVMVNVYHVLTASGLPSDKCSQISSLLLISKKEVWQRFAPLGAHPCVFPVFAWSKTVDDVRVVESRSSLNPLKTKASTGKFVPPFGTPAPEAVGAVLSTTIAAVVN